MGTLVMKIVFGLTYLILHIRCRTLMRTVVVPKEILQTFNLPTQTGVHSLGIIAWLALVGRRENLTGIIVVELAGLEAERRVCPGS